jgi:hypothetical protein
MLGSGHDRFLLGLAAIATSLRATTVLAPARKLAIDRAGKSTAGASLAERRASFATVTDVDDDGTGGRFRSSATGLGARAPAVPARNLAINGARKTIAG